MSEQDLLNALVGGVCMGVEGEYVRGLLNRLPARQRKVLSGIFGVEDGREGLKEISSTYNVSKERIRQIEAKALGQMRRLLFDEYDEVFTGVVLASKQDVRCKKVVLPVLSEEDAQWLVGFCEGDGCLVMNKQEHSFVTLSQKEPDVLEYVESILLGGAWHFRKKKSIWTLTYSRKEVKDMLFKVLTKYVVGLHTLERLNDILADSGVAATSHKPTIDWLAGFFDAEGTANWNTPSGGIQIGQKDGSVLDAIQRSFGGSVSQVSSGYFEWYAGKRKSDLVGLVSSLHKRSHKYSVHEALTKLLIRLYVEEHHIC